MMVSPQKVANFPEGLLCPSMPRRPLMVRGCAQRCPRWQKQYRTSEKHSKTRVFGLTKNTEKHFYHLGYRG